MFRSLSLYSLILLSSLVAQNAPDPARIKALHEQIKARALDPTNLATLGKTAFGCRPDEEGSNTNDFSTASRAAGVTSVNPKLQSPVSDANPIPPEDRAPRFFPTGQRRVVTEFTFIDPTGLEKKVAELAGKTIVVFLFKPDCKYTPEVIGEIIRLQNMHQGKAYDVIPVSMGSEGWSGLTRWRQLNLNVIPKEFPIYRPGIKSGTGTSIFGALVATPTTLILDRHGCVAWQINGAIRGAVAERLNQVMLEGLLETLPASKP